MVNKVWNHLSDIELDREYENYAIIEGIRKKQISFHPGLFRENL